MARTVENGSLVSLYTRVAMAADAAYSAALKRHDMDRWTTPRKEQDAVPEVKAAYEEKVRADEHMHQAWELWRS